MNELELLKKENEEMRRLLKLCWSIIPISQNKWNNVFLQVHNFLNK